MPEKRLRRDASLGGKAAICLFIDSNNVASIFSSLRNQETPVVIIRARKRNLGDNIAKASELISAGLDVVIELSSEGFRHLMPL